MNLSITTATNAIGSSLTVTEALLQRGTASGLQLQQATGKSQAALSRAIAALGTEVLTLGRARQTRYALTQTIVGRAAQQALVATDATGTRQDWGRLTFLRGQQVCVESTLLSGPSLTTGALPWFLAPLVPSGFLGRLRGRQLGYTNSNPEAWSTEQVLHAVLAFEQDGPGALSIGAPPLQDIAPEIAPDIAPGTVPYAQLALQVAQTLPAGSSAGGEQAKFLTERRLSDGGYEHLIVKFTPPRGTPFGERWHDVLHTEALAAQVLQAHGIAAAATQVVHDTVSALPSALSRTYLESVRFDRVGLRGKRHVVALADIHAAFVGGAREHWAATCDHLVRLGLLGAQDAHTVHVIREFGRLIHNTDMHFGNLSLYVDPLQDMTRPVFRLAPVYDMLSMAWRPNEFRDEMGYTPRETPQGSGAAWQQALAMAEVFWHHLSQNASVSAAFRGIAVKQRDALHS